MTSDEQQQLVQDTVSAANAGIVESIDTLTKTHPELSPVLIRALLIESFLHIELGDGVDGWGSSLLIGPYTSFLIRS